MSIGPVLLNFVGIRQSYHIFGRFEVNQIVIGCNSNMLNKSSLYELTLKIQMILKRVMISHLIYD